MHQVQWHSQNRGKEGTLPPLTAKKIVKKSGKNREKEEKLGRKGQNWEGSFT